MIRGMSQGFAPATSYPGGISSGLTLWLDANDSSTVASSGGAVSSWVDKVSSRNFAQATGASKPTVDTTTFTGKNAIAFAATQNLLSASALSLPSTFSIFLVQWVTSTLGPNSCFICNSSTTIQNGTDHFGHFAANGTNQYLELGTYQSSGNVVRYAYNTANPISGVKTQATAVADGNPANLVFRRNGAALSHSDSSPGVSTGLSLDLIGQPGGLYSSSGVMAEIVAYNRTLNSTEYAAVESYLKAKWGTP